MHVLVGVAGSEESARALESVLERAAVAGDELTVAVFAYPDQSLDDVEEAVRDRLADADLAWSVVRIEDDHPASSLVELAEEGPYDQLAIGGGRRSPMGKIDLGPITEFVLLNAQLTVRLERPAEPGYCPGDGAGDDPPGDGAGDDPPGDGAGDDPTGESHR